MNTENPLTSEQARWLEHELELERVVPPVHREGSVRPALEYESLDSKQIDAVLAGEPLPGLEPEKDEDDGDEAEEEEVDAKKKDEEKEQEEKRSLFGSPSPLGTLNEDPSKS